MYACLVINKRENKTIYHVLHSIHNRKSSNQRQYIITVGVFLFGFLWHSLHISLSSISDTNNSLAKTYVLYEINILFG